jgi:hypothetical protein
MVSTVPKTRPAYPDEFRREAVQMLRAGRTPRELAESLGVSQHVQEPPSGLKTARARSWTVSGARSSIRLASDHSWPKGSRTFA